MDKILPYKRQIAVLAFFVFTFSLLPIADVYHAVGTEWRGVPPVYTDEDYYYARINEIKNGYPFLGNPYFYEHRGDLAPAFFVTDWIAAIPLVLGASLPATLAFNFSLWSLIFTFLAFIVFLELRINKNVAALGVFLLYIQSYLWMLRPVSLQQILPFFLLFILAALRWYRSPDKRSMKIFLAIATAATFYIYAYLWQIIVSALLLLGAILLARRDWARLRSIAHISAISFLLALPAVIYTAIQISNHFYWETMQRVSLVYTHLPTAEVVYSGSWVVLALLIFFLLRKRVSVEDIPALAVLPILGIALVGVQASNLITGKEMETAIHVKHFIIPWLGISFGAIVALLFCSVPDFAKQKKVRWVGILLILILGMGNVYFMMKDFPRFFVDPARDARFLKLQTLAAPFRYLDTAEASPVVVWVMNPESDFAYYLPALTKHYVLYSHPGMWHLVSDKETIERYLTANYPQPVTQSSLIAGLGAYAGPAAFAHRANTVNRGVRLCQLLQLDKLGYSCGKLVTPDGLLGEAYFDNIIRYNENEIRPHIRELLTKYQVSYVVSSEPLSPSLEHLFNMQLVYHDQNYLIYSLGR